jgi:hypothetical protein
MAITGIGARVAPAVVALLALMAGRVDAAAQRKGS